MTSSIDLFQKWRLANQAAMLAAKATVLRAVLALDGNVDGGVDPLLFGGQDAVPLGGIGARM